MPPSTSGFAELVGAVATATATATAATLRGVERWLLPASCLLCEEPISTADDPLVCALCRLRWRRVPHPVCGRCGQPREAEQGRASECLVCRDWLPGLDRARSAVWLDGSAREIAHRLKYDGWWRAAEAMAEPMVEAVRCLEPLTDEVFLVPIPLGVRRRRERGYNQSERLAGALAARVGLAVRPELLTRGRETRSQTALTPEERRMNVEGAFRAHEVAGAAVILVDDVFTTGATLIAAATALAAAGAARVDAVTFARAVGPIDRLAAGG